MYTLGEVLVSEGPIMAASDKFEIKVHGKGGHGAAPHQTVDAIVEAATLISSLQTIVSRNIDPLDAGVITCGRYIYKWVYVFYVLCIIYTHYTTVLYTPYGYIYTILTKVDMYTCLYTI